MKYKAYLKQICESADRQGIALTFAELKQTARYRWERDHGRQYGWRE